MYKHTFPNGKVYIGITSCDDPNKRWQDGYGYYEQPFIYNAIQKYGWYNVEHEILFDSLTWEEAKQKEIELIASYKSNDREFGYNLTCGGEGQLGRVWTEEQKKNLSQSKLSWRVFPSTIICLETEKVYQSSWHASQRLNIPERQIVRCLKKKIPHTVQKLKTKEKIFHWEYWSEYTERNGLPLI